MKLFAGTGGLMTGFVGAIIEAWAQLRIGKVRVLLSLVGVGAAVAAMSFVIAIGQVSVTAINSDMEKYMGRPGTVTISVSPTGKDVTASGHDDSEDGDSSDSGQSNSDEAGSKASGAPDSGQAGSGQSNSNQGSAGSGQGSAGASKETSAKTSERVDRALASFVTRYEASSWATTYTTKLRFAFPDGPRQVSTQAVSLGYGTLHHTQVKQGRWFSSEDVDDASPTLVVSQGFLDALGISELTQPVTVTSYTPVRTTFTIVGVLKPDRSTDYCTTTDTNGETIPCPQPLSAFVLKDAYEQQLPEEAERPTPTLEIWAGKDQTKEVKNLAKKNLDAQFGKGSTQVSDNLGNNSNLSADGFTSVVTAAGVLHHDPGRPEPGEHLDGHGAPAHPRDRGAALLRGDEPTDLLLHHAGVRGGDRRSRRGRRRPRDRGAQGRAAGRPAGGNRDRGQSALPHAGGRDRAAGGGRRGSAVRHHPAIVAVRIRPIDAIRY